MDILIGVYLICWLASILAGNFVFWSVRVNRKTSRIPERVIYVMYVFLFACLMSPITGIFAFLVGLGVIHIKLLDNYVEPPEKND